MFTGSIMHTTLITIDPEATLSEAKQTLERNHIDHLLVVDDRGKLAGIVSDRDIKQYWASPANTLSTHELNYLIEKILVRMIMVKAVVTVSPDTTVERAALIMQTNDISALPVMERGELVGIVTVTDVLAVLLEAIGISEDSVRICVLVADRIGTIAEVTALLRDNDINIESLVTWPLRQHPGIHQLVLRLSGDDGPKGAAILNKNKYKVMTRYVKDLTPYLPGSA